MLDFIQNQQASGNSGVRALEFEASNTPSSVPEPTSLSLIFASAAVLCARRKQS
jgi:hypothetical protein